MVERGIKTSAARISEETVRNCYKHREITRWRKDMNQKGTVHSSSLARSGSLVKYTDKAAQSIFTAFGAVTREPEEVSR